MASRGRPKIKIDQQNFESLCGLQCTLEEIAGFFKCSEDTVQNWCKSTYGEIFSVVYKKHSGSGKIALRRYQMNLAKKNATMAIWLGKQILGQRDISVVEGNVTMDSPCRNLTEADLLSIARAADDK